MSREGYCGIPGAAAPTEDDAAEHKIVGTAVHKEGEGNE